MRFSRLVFLRNCEPRAGHRYGEAEGGAFSDLGVLDPDPAAVLFDKPLADREADAAAWVLLAAVQALEQPEHLFAEALFDANSVVAYGEYTPAVALLR